VLKRKGHVASMTGDGVNDAPALKKADIGVAMGITGTDVSKEAAVMILTDDNFATIVRAVELGRELYDNLVKYIRFQMVRLFSLILLFLGAALFNILAGIPFLPLQTLYLNFAVDVLLAIGLGLGAPSPGLMKRKPRGAHADILPHSHLLTLAGIGLVMAASILVVMNWASAPLGDTVARSMGVVTFALSGIFLSFVINDERDTVFSSKTFENRKLLQMCAFALIATIAVTEVGLFQRLFGTASLSLDQWVICLLAGLVAGLVFELLKLVLRHRAGQPG
jgi:P-type Ca2+ transporter type 2C